MEKLRAYIISLKRSIDRRREMQDRIDELFKNKPKLASILEFRFFDAVDAKALEHLEFRECRGDFLSKIFRGKRLSDGEKACYASHFALWKLCIKTNKPCLILEDDVGFLDGFDRVVERLCALDYKPEYMRLRASGKFKIYSELKKFEDGDKWAFVREKASGTQGYYLTPSSAKKFISHSRHFIFPVDDYMDMFFIHRVESVLSLPYVLEDLGQISQIGDRKVKLSLTCKLSREIFKVFLDIYRAIYMLIFPKPDRIK